jgi:hypothetical protein
MNEQIVTVDGEPTFEFEYKDGKVKLLTRLKADKATGMASMPLPHPGEAEQIAETIQKEFPNMRRGYGKVFDKGDLVIGIEVWSEDDGEPKNLLPLRP